MTFCGGVSMVFERREPAVWVRWLRKVPANWGILHFSGLQSSRELGGRVGCSSYLAFSEVNFKQRKLEHFIELLYKLASFFAINIMHLILAETYFWLQKVPVLILTGKYHQSGQWRRLTKIVLLNKPGCWSVNINVINSPQCTAEFYVRISIMTVMSSIIFVSVLWLSCRVLCPCSIEL